MARFAEEYATNTVEFVQDVAEGSATSAKSVSIESVCLTSTRHCAGCDDDWQMQSAGHPQGIGLEGTSPADSVQAGAQTAVKL